MVVDGVILAGVSAVLVGLWWHATRRHAGRRGPQRAEWDDAHAPRLWTSATACPSCRAGGGLVCTEGGEVWFTCLSCGDRHRRETKA